MEIQSDNQLIDNIEILLKRSVDRDPITFDAKHTGLGGEESAQDDPLATTLPSANTVDVHSDAFPSMSKQP